MLVKDLIKELSALPQDLPVAVYIGEAEEYGNTEKVSVYTEEKKSDLPYAKADKPENAVPFVLIEGFSI